MPSAISCQPGLLRKAARGRASFNERRMRMGRHCEVKGSVIINGGPRSGVKISAAGLYSESIGYFAVPGAAALANQLVLPWSLLHLQRRKIYFTSFWITAKSFSVSKGFTIQPVAHDVGFIDSPVRRFQNGGGDIRRQQTKMKAGMRQSVLAQDHGQCVWLLASRAPCAPHKQFLRTVAAPHQFGKRTLPQEIEMAGLAEEISFVRGPAPTRARSTREIGICLEEIRSWTKNVSVMTGAFGWLRGPALGRI